MEETIRKHKGTQSTVAAEDDSDSDGEDENNIRIEIDENSKRKLEDERSKSKTEDNKEEEQPMEKTTEQPKPERTIEVMDILLNEVSIRTKALGKSLVVGIDLLKSLAENHVAVLKNPQAYSENWIYLIIPTLLVLMAVGLLLNAVIPSNKTPEKKRGRPSKNKTN